MKAGAPFLKGSRSMSVTGLGALVLVIPTLHDGLLRSVGLETSAITAVGLMGLVAFKLIKALVGDRTSPVAELNGLDVPEMGVPGYAGVKLDRYAETPLPRKTAATFNGK